MKDAPSSFYPFWMIYKLSLSLKDYSRFIRLTFVTCLFRQKKFKMFKTPVEPSLKCKITISRPMAKVFLLHIYILDNEFTGILDPHA